MTEHELVFDPENKVDQRHGYYMFFTSIVFFGSLNLIVTALGKPENVKAESWKWTNLVISWIHGFIVGLWDILW